MNINDYCKELDHDLSVCDYFLKSYKGLEYSELQHWLSVYFLLKITGTYENIILNILENRIMNCDDVEITNFIKNTLKHSKLLKIEDIKSLLKKFNEQKKSEFKKQIDLDLKSKSDYDTIATNRNEFAHGGKINLTWVELLDMYASSQKMLFIFEKILERG